MIRSIELVSGPFEEQASGSVVKDIEIPAVHGLSPGVPLVASRIVPDGSDGFSATSSCYASGFPLQLRRVCRPEQPFPNGMKKFGKCAGATACSPCRRWDGLRS